MEHSEIMGIGQFQSVIDEAAIDFFKKMGFDYNENGPFVQYVNYQLKLIEPKPRQVSYSKQFKVSKENLAGFNELVKQIQNGADINCYLSKKSIDPRFSDDLLDNFGVKHFHLGELLKGDFIERTGEIALGFVTLNEIFFISAKMHGIGHGTIWYEKDVFETIHDERPDLIEHLKYNYVLDIAPVITKPEDLKALTKAHVTCAITLDNGTSYAPPMIARSAAGYPIECTVEYIQLSKALKNEWDMDISCLENEGYKYISGRVTNFEFTSAKRIDYCFEFKLKVPSTDPNYPNGEKDVKIPHCLEKGRIPVSLNNIQVK